GHAVQQAGSSARADPLQRRPGRRAQLPRRAELQRRRAARRRSVRDAEGGFGDGAETARRREHRVTTALNTKYTFETFVVGTANRLAVTAGRTGAENPGTADNRLFIYSGSGLGKTHALIGIGPAAKAAAP